MSRAPMTLIDAINDPHLFPPWFRDRATWQAWFSFLSALFALPMTPDQLAIYRQCTGRNEPPSSVAREAWLICGRRAGKSFILALIAVFLACFFDYRKYLIPGERGTILIIAVDRKQARTILRYIRGLLTNVSMLKRLIERETAEGFDLSNNITIEIGTASFRSTRGVTCVSALIDEAAYIPNSETSADPDHEILNAIRPAMATIPNAMLLVASSPYARRGILYDAHKKHYGKDGDPILVWQAATRVMNPSVPQSFIDAAYERDPASAAAEYGAQFRSDVESFVSREAVEACVSTGIRERAPISGIRYVGFLDAAGGSGKDSMTLAIAHRENDIALLDAVREFKPPFSPELVTADFARLLSTYGVSAITSDRFAGDWPVEAFSKHKIKVVPAAKPKSDIYREFLPMLNSAKVDLLDDPKLIAQLVSLERKTGKNKDVVDHPPSGHDDRINSAAGALVSLSNSSRYDLSALAGMFSGAGDDNGSEAWRRQRLQHFIFSGGRTIL